MFIGVIVGMTGLAKYPSPIWRRAAAAVLAAALLLLFPCRLHGQPVGDSDAAGVLDSCNVNTAFQPGEELVYDIKYGVIKGGELRIRVSLEQVGYGYYFHVLARCSSTGVVAKLASICDIYESWFDISTGLPIQAIRNVAENNYKRYNVDLFFQDSLYVLSMKSGRHSLGGHTLDIISAFYYARRFIFDSGDSDTSTSMLLDTWFNEKLYSLSLRRKSREVVKTGFGKIECLRYVPALGASSSFKREDDMQAWFTNDGNYVPVRIRIRMPVADIRCELREFSGLKGSGGLLMLARGGG